MKIEGTPKEIAEFLDIMKQDKIIAGAITTKKLDDKLKNEPIYHFSSPGPGVNIANCGCDLYMKLADLTHN